MDDGHIVVDSIEPIRIRDITYDLARESGFETVKALLEMARHGSSHKAYLIRFHYLPAGAWDTESKNLKSNLKSDRKSNLKSNLKSKSEI